MKTLFMGLIIFFSSQMTAHAQSYSHYLSEPPQAEEVTRSQRYDELTDSNDRPVLVELYENGCGWYNGEVPIVNEIIRIYGSSLKVIEVDMTSEAGREMERENARINFSGASMSPQFHLFYQGSEWAKGGALPANFIAQWVGDRTGLMPGQ